ncbi:DUF6350 family protein [Agromyces atrinae]|uniref:cell division protein PerM n=1 Tax=Agromyces atrinae TaxID=592376 RepID=UPI001F5A6ED4|nr:DUF6350 family protein [Agromyces atrinae]MCI2957891.1 DUF6350 family protein [Agromyces atrinae]
MKRSTTVLLSALEAFVIVAVGFGAALVPLTLLWATTFGLAVDFGAFWRTAADVWLLGNGVDVVVRFDEATALSLGATTEAFTLSIAALGFAVLTVLLAARVGRRAAEAGHILAGLVSGVVVVAAFAALLGLTAGSAVASPVVVQALIFPPLVFAGGFLLGAIAEQRRSATGLEVPGLLGDRLADIPSAVRSAIADAARGGGVAVSGILAVSAAVVGVLILADYATLASLYQTLQAGIVGGLALTLAQLALLPNAIVWTASWLLGPGFALGTGTTVSPGGTVIGPLPGIPLLGIVPSETPAVGLFGLLVPVVLGFAVGYVLERRAVDGTWLTTALRGVGIGLVAGVLLGLLAWWSSGAAGPGRLVDVGPDGLIVGAVAAAAVGVPALLGSVSARATNRVSSTL